MINNFRHKGLEAFSTTGSTAGIQPNHVRRLRLILTVLSQAVKIQDLSLPGLHLHPLRGNRKGCWAVKVSGNWRVVFRFENGDVFDVELLDYH